MTATFRPLLRAGGARICALLSLCLSASTALLPAQTLPAAHQYRPVLTTARQVHQLAPDQAALALPVRLRGVVTFYDPWQAGHKALFIADASGGIFIAPGPAPLPPMHAGSVIAVSGVTDPGGFAPIVSDPQIRLLPGTLPLPKPLRVQLPLLLTGAEDGQWIEIEGVVRAAEPDAKHVVLTVATPDGTFSATTVREDRANYNALVDAKILLRGVATPLVDAKRRLLGIRILFPGLSTVSVEEPALPEVFSLPVQPLSRLLRYSSTVPSPHRIHVRGTVTLSWPGQRVCVADGSDALCMETQDPVPLKEGQIVDAVGFLDRKNYVPQLSNALLRVSGAGSAIPAVRISPADTFGGDHEGDRVRMEGTLFGIDRKDGFTTLLISSAGTLFPAILPSTSFDQQSLPSQKWVEGSRVAVTGVFSGNVDTHWITRQEGKARWESFQILLQSPEDIRILESPSWWNSRHSLAVLEVVAFSTLIFLVWVFALRRQVHRQTLTIRRSEERFRYMAEHDALTGLCARTVFFERLSSAIAEAARRSSSLAIMAIDVDDFKHLNDSLGHQAGDTVLCAVARRIQSAVRETDTVARIGGDEFVILLPGVHGTEEAYVIAAKILAVASDSVSIREDPVAVTVSIGVTVFPDGGLDATSLLRSADVALYRAKAIGRNCFQLFSPSPAASPGFSLTGQVHTISSC